MMCKIVHNLERYPCNIAIDLFLGVLEFNVNGVSNDNSRADSK